MRGRSKANGHDFGVVIGGVQQPPVTVVAPVRGAANPNPRFVNQQQNPPAGRQQQADLSFAIQKALQTGQLHFPNRGVTALPWDKMFPDEDEGALDDDNGGVAPKVTSLPAAGMTPLRTGRRIVQQQQPQQRSFVDRARGSNAVDIDLSVSGGDGPSALRSKPAREIKWWEGHPIQQLDCSSNGIDDLLATDAEHNMPRFTRLGDTLKLMQASRNALTSLPSFAGYSQLATLDVAHNRLSGDLVKLLLFGSQSPQQQLVQPPQTPVLSSLVELNASNNAINAITGLLEVVAPNLRVCRLANNQIEMFSFLTAATEQQAQQQGQQQPPRIVSTLRELDLSHNKLIVHPLISSPHGEAVSHPCLELVDFSFNQFGLGCPDVSIGQEQQQQSQQQQQVHPAWRQHLTSVKSINLRHTGTTSLALHTLPQLQEINASENGLTQFPFICVASRQSLAAIDLSGNKIANLDGLVANFNNNSNTPPFPSLVRIDLSNNEISAVPPRLCLLPKLNNIALNGNPLRAIRRELLAKNATELKAYLRSRLDERENDEAAVNSNAALKLQHAMENVQEQQQFQQQSEARFSNVAPSSSVRAHGAVAPAAVATQPVGVKIGNLWDLSKAVTRRGVGATTARGLQLPGTINSHSANTNDNVPLLPEILTAATILDVSPHTRDHVSASCSKLTLSGQQRVKTITTDFFAALVPNLTELDASRTALASLQEILGDAQGPLSLKSLTASHCNLEGLWPVSWCRPLPPDKQALVRLDISNNGLTELVPEFGLAVCWSLRFLNVSSNRLSRFPEALLHLRLLNELHYSRNNLRDDSLPDNMAVFFPEMTVLDLSFNDVRSVHHIPRALGGFDANVLRALKLEGNGIRFLSTQLIEGPSVHLIAAIKDRCPQQQQYKLQQYQQQQQQAVQFQ